MVSTGSQNEPGQVDSSASTDVGTLCTGICRSLRTTKKKGAQNLLQEVERLNTAVAQTGGQQNAVLNELRAIEETVGYWTEKRTGPRFRRAFDPPWKSARTLEDCSQRVRALLEQITNTNQNSPPPGPSSASPQAGIEPANIKDTILGGFKLFLISASGVADVIPDPAGKIVKAVAESAVRIMEVLDNIDDNKTDARKLGGHVRSLVQAIVQYLRHKEDMPNAGLNDDKVTALLQEFLSTLENISTKLKALQEQGRFTQVALHEQNKGDLEKFGREVERAYWQLQVCLSLCMFQSIRGVESANATERRQSLLDRLKGADNGAGDKADASGGMPGCLPDTRKEVLAFIKTWISESSKRIFWLNGVAGCGKTSVAATIALLQEELHNTTAIFYCTAGNQARCRRVVCSLAHWMARSSHNSLEGAILEAISSEPDIADLPLAQQVQLLLSTPLQDLAPEAPPVVLIIDALDEWYDTKKVSALITLLIKLAGSVDVKILITSRDEKHIKHAFSEAPEDAIEVFELDSVDPQLVDGDIEIFLRKHLSYLHKRHRLDADWPGPERLKALVRKSEHLFQFAATVLRYIQLGYPPVALNQVLDGPNTSRTLHTLYLTILQRLFQDAPDVSDAWVLKHVLVCLVCSAVPVSLDVIAYLWDWNYPMDATTKINYIRQSVLDHLGSFLVVPVDLTEPIRFLHTSIVDFLVNPARLQDDARFFVDVTQGHAYLAQRCLERLNRDLKADICGLQDFRCGVDGTDGRPNSKPDPAFDKVVAVAICPGLQYASLHWNHHLELVPTSPTPVELLPLVHAFASTHILHWIEVLAFLRSVLFVGHPASRKAADWCMRVTSADLSKSSSLFGDTTRFIGLFLNVISSQPLILYEYTLSFVPIVSALRKTYGTRRNLRIKVIRGPMQKRWPAHQWTATHGGGVLCVALSPDGLIFASSGIDYKISLWDAASGMPMGEPLEGHTDCVRSLIFNRDGKLLVSSSDDKTIRIWDVETGRARGDPLTGHTSRVGSVALSPDDTIVASGSEDGTVRFWGLESGREMGEPLKLGAGEVHSVAFTLDGSTVVCGCGDGSVRRWKVKTREEVGEAMTGHTGEVLTVCVSPNGKIITSGSDDKSLRMWDTETGEQIGAPLEGHTGEINSVAFSPDGETIVSGSADHTMGLWDARTGKQRGKALTGHTSWVRAVVFTRDGKSVISGSSDRTVRAWDVDGVEEEGEQVEGHSEWVVSVAFTLDARFVATGSRDGSIMVWSAETGILLGKVESGYKWGKLHFSAGGKALREDGEVYGGWDGVVREWDVSGAVEGTGAEIRDRQAALDRTLEFPDLGVERLWIDDEGWIKRGGRKLLWVPPPSGWYNYCHLLGTKLVLETRHVPILDVANLL